MISLVMEENRKRGMNVSKVVKRIAKLQLYGNDLRAQAYNEGLTAAIHIVESQDQPQLNENQQIVLEWLKEEKNNSNLTAFDCIYSFIYGNPEDLVTQNWAELNAKEEAQVLEAFGQWAQEQEEE